MERRHLIVLFAVAVASLGGLEARLFWLQVVEYGEYEQRVKARRFVRIVEPPRGPILDRNGVVLARDERAFALDVLLEDFAKDERSAGRLAALLQRPEAEVLGRIEGLVRQMNRIAARRPEREHQAIMRREFRTPYPLYKHITFEQAFAIELNPGAFPGLVVREGRRRYYPEGAWAGHLTHYLQAITAEERDAMLASRAGLERLDGAIGIEGVDALASRGAFDAWTVGRGGIEQQYDARLRGKPGLVLVEKRRREDPIEVELLPVEPGENVTLTIDIEVQTVALAALGAARGAIVVMDIRDGSIVVMAGTPAFDPNLFIPPVEGNPFDVIGEGSPMLNRAIRYPYPPGSVFKPVVALASGDASRLVHCDGVFEGRDRNLRCMGTHGDMAMVEALSRSCNEYFYTLGAELEVPAMAAWAIRMGFGTPTGVDLPAERDGLIPRRGRFDIAAMFAIGQDKVLVTPLQVARAMAFVANGGRLVRPRVTLLQEVRVDRNPTLPASLMEPVRRGMIAAVESGTARNTRLRDFRVAGKTGSAQTGGGRPAHAWFGGYWPHDDPAYAIAVVVEHGGHGGDVAAPLAETVVRSLQSSVLSPQSGSPGGQGGTRTEDGRLRTED